MLQEFWEEVDLARDPGQVRPDVLLYARYITEHLPPPLLPIPQPASQIPGRGQGGESSN
jgi:hypothetical protein